MKPSTQVLVVDPQQPQADAIAAAAAIIRRGGLVAFPTETVYGLGANALDAAAVARIYEAKGRPSNNPLIVHVASAGDAAVLTEVWPASAQLLAEHFWPGPLTMVLPRSGLIPNIVSGGGSTVAVRCPRHAVARALIGAAELPLAAPSANRSSLLSPTRVHHVLRSLQGRIDAVIDGGPCSDGIESTVIDLSQVKPRLLRPGPISLTELERLLGPVEQKPIRATEKAAMPSPGLFARHYAPTTALEALPSFERLRERALALAGSGLRVGAVVSRTLRLPSSSAMEVILPADAPSFAQELYRALHDLDEAGLDRLLVCLPPEGDEWLAVRDRLIRASTPE